MNKSVEVLNRAFKADPNAIHALLVNRVPCNRGIADDPTIVVEGVPVLESVHFQVGAMGLINGILEANGLPKVAVQWSDEQNIEGRYQIIGFCEYVPPELEPSVSE